MGDRLFHLMTDSESDRIRWTTALESSMKTVKEMNNNLKIVITKNIDPIIKLYDSQQSLIVKKEKLREKILLDFEVIKNKSLGTLKYNDSLENLLKFLTPLAKDMLDTFNSCIVKDPQRKDLIKEYIDFLHERICELITIFWDNHHETVDSVSLLKLSFWLHKYS